MICMNRRTWSFNEKEDAVMHGEPLTYQELQTFKRHFVQEVDKSMREDHIQSIQNKTERDRIWNQEVGRALQNQKPVVTRSLVHKINSKKLGWESRVDAPVAEMSMIDVRRLCGAKEDIDEGTSSLVEVGLWPFGRKEDDPPPAGVS